MYCTVTVCVGMRFNSKGILVKRKRKGFPYKTNFSEVLAKPDPAQLPRSHEIRDVQVEWL